MLEDAWHKLPLTTVFPAEADIVTCSLCRTFLPRQISPYTLQSHATHTLMHKETIRIALGFDHPATSHIEHIQRSYLVALEHKFPQYSQYPLCIKCQTSLQKSPRITTQPAKHRKNRRWRQNQRQRKNTQQTNTPTNVVASVIQYVSSGAAIECPEKRSIPSVMYALARRLQHEDGSFKYNALLYHCPPCFQQIVTWMHERNLNTKNMHVFTMACAASYWLYNGLCFWGPSRDTMRMIRAYARNHFKKPFLISDAEYEQDQKTFNIN